MIMPPPEPLGKHRYTSHVRRQTRSPRRFDGKMGNHSFFSTLCEIPSQIMLFTLQIKCRRPDYSGVRQPASARTPNSTKHTTHLTPIQVCDGGHQSPGSANASETCATATTIAFQKSGPSQAAPRYQLLEGAGQGAPPSVAAGRR